MKPFLPLGFQIVFVLFLLAVVPSAQASQCISHSDIWAYVEEADYIFSAQIISISSNQLERRPLVPEKSFMSPVRLELGFDPMVVLKGNIDELPQLVTWTGFGLGPDFHVGRDYYFFVEQNGEVTACSATYELEQMDRGERAEFLARAGFQSPESVEAARQWEAFNRWEKALWEEFNASDQPWLWALYLNNLVRLNYPSEVFEFAAGQVVNRLLDHRDPGAAALYWASLFCLQLSSEARYCRTGELLDRLHAADPENLAVWGLLDVADNLEVERESSKQWGVPGFDEWLQEAAAGVRRETYEYAHFGELAELLAEYGERNGFYTPLRGAPLDWRVIYYLLEQPVYPEFGGGYFHPGCKSSDVDGNPDGEAKSLQACQELAEGMVTTSRTFRQRGSAYFSLGMTYPKSDARYVRNLREGAAWNGPVKRCMDRLYQSEGQPWLISADANEFMGTFTADGEIAAFRKLARAEGWSHTGTDGKSHACESLPALADSELVLLQGFQDPAWFHCSTEDPCHPEFGEKQ
jgi:hypothetical protein